jgi:glycosyltransferase involved in cell wall biosynthesis
MNEFNNIKLSIIMINYNWLSYLKKTINWLIEQTYKNFEFIIVDNWSIDGSIEFINSFENIKLIKSHKIWEKNYACNLWVKNANWEYLLILDNDALIEDNDFIKKVFESNLIMNENTWIIAFPFFNENEKKIEWVWWFFNFNFIKWYKKIDFNNIWMYNWLEIWFPHGLAFFIKKEIWNKIWWYDEFLKFWWDDNDLWIKSWIFWYKNYLFSEIIVNHIWIAERNNTSKYNIKFTNIVLSHLYTITKNFKLHNLIIVFTTHSIFLFIKSIKQSIFRGNIWPFTGFFKWYYLFLINIKLIMKNRKNIQKNRIIKDDIFLDIKIKKQITIQKALQN